MTSNLDMVPEPLKIEVLAQAAWARIGVKLDIQTVEPPSQFFGPTPSAGAFDVTDFFNDRAAYDPDDHWLCMCNQTPQLGGSNYWHDCKPVVDQWETEQQRTADESARRADFRAIDHAIRSKLPVMYRIYPSHHRGVSHNAAQLPACRSEL